MDSSKQVNISDIWIVDTNDLHSSNVDSGIFEHFETIKKKKKLDRRKWNKSIWVYQVINLFSIDTSLIATKKKPPSSPKFLEI